MAKVSQRVQKIQTKLELKNYKGIEALKLLKEFKSFVRHSNGTWSAQKGAGYHDDRVMSFVWALIILDKDLVDKHFEVIQHDSNNRPLILKQLDFGIKYYTIIS